MGLGWSYARVGQELGIAWETVKSHVENIAALLDNPDQLEAPVLVRLWAGARIWRAMMTVKKLERPHH